MSENKKLELLDQYDDVTVALLMDEYAEEEGARLRKEFEEAQAAGEVSDTSDALDEKCLQMIHRDFAKKRGKDNVRKFIRMTSKVAVAVMVFLGVATATIFSVDALRIPVLDFLVEHFDQYSTLTFEPHSESQKHTCAEVFKKLLPDDYREVSSTITEHMTLVTYENSLGNVAQLYVTPAGGEVNIDTENAIYSEVELSGYIAILLEKDGYQVTWTDSDAGLLYMVHADGFTKDFVLEICQAIATHTD